MEEQAIEVVTEREIDLKTMTFEDMLKLDGFQSEFDKRVGKALNTKEKALKSEFEGILAKRDADLNELQEKLKDFDGTNSAFQELQAKYEQEKLETQAKFEGQRYEFAIKELSNDLKFSSNSAKNYFISQLMGNKLTIDQNGKVMGFNDFVESYKENDPNSFVVEAEPVEDVKAVPTFTTDSTPAQVEESPFNFLKGIGQINI